MLAVPGIPSSAVRNQWRRSPWTLRVGNWANVHNRYLGVEFKIKGKIHYGWARLSVQLVAAASWKNYANSRAAMKTAIRTLPICASSG